MFYFCITRNRLLEIFGCKEIEQCLKQANQTLTFFNKTEHKIVDNTAQLQTNCLFDDTMLKNIRGSENFSNHTSKLKLLTSYNADINELFR